ncbi:RNA polymerase sigma factor [Paenibacillus sp. J2TS4]|uniref:RNA polymerase sigma factor n=1 Tax=Paenibacillus sp. J2TS4 TaxID=2807194 RepID=UPI001B264622|nr:sigma-70 family RNA polymerase sigma factor [Paenibacillus sp. J2TS4]GIP34481.1 hypothetical protein J2TS4_36910 [Paenibacillus sp. J2TS4]
MTKATDLSKREIGLAERAREGDAEAFGELVRLHRERALGIAKRIVRDGQKAEDVVQEALIQAFKHIDRLADVERFAPWLSRIVRNEALMNVRETTRLSREMVFSGLENGRGKGDKKGNGTITAGVGQKLDRMLYQLSRNAERRSGFAADDPERVWLQREFLAAIHRMLHGLSAREREVFEAYVFQQLAPQEIAEALGMSEGSVYKAISRSRHKVKEARVREYLRDRVDAASHGSARQASMLLPLCWKAEEWKVAENSFAVCVFHYLRHAGCRNLSISDVMGFTGQAFRLSLETARIGVSGPAMYFWEPIFAEGLANLGLSVQHIGDGGVAPTAYMLGEAVTLARNEIAAGRAVIAWDLFAPKFGLLFGYDDDRQQLTGDDGGGTRKLAYDCLGNGTDGGLFVLAMEPKSKSWHLSPERGLMGTIAMVEAHAYGELTFPGYANGMAAYEAWITAFRNGTVDPLGNSYTILVAADARKHAVHFIRKWSAGWKGEKERLAFEAEGHYYEAAEGFAHLAARFPFPSGGTPQEPSEAKKAIDLLLTIQASEEAGLAALKRLSRCLQLEEEEKER